MALHISQTSRYILPDNRSHYALLEDAPRERRSRLDQGDGPLRGHCGHFASVHHGGGGGRPGGSSCAAPDCDCATFIEPEGARVPLGADNLTPIHFPPPLPQRPPARPRRGSRRASSLPRPRNMDMPVSRNAISAPPVRSTPSLESSLRQSLTAHCWLMASVAEPSGAPAYRLQMARPALGPGADIVVLDNDWQMVVVTARGQWQHGARAS